MTEFLKKIAFIVMKYVYIYHKVTIVNLFIETKLFIVVYSRN